MKSRLEGFRKALTWVAGLLSLARYLPFLGQWRAAVIALAALLTGLAGLLEKCDSNQPPSQTIPTPPTSTPTPIQTHTPSPTPSPKPTPLIIVPERIATGEPFLVRITSKFDYGVKLYVDRFELCTLGKEYKTNYFVCTVTLWTAGKRLLNVRLPDGKLEAWINVQKAGPRAE